MFHPAADGVELANPRFCPRCGIAGRADRELCAECGETLRSQGYCPICEGFRRQDVGTDCPKHDVELVAEPPRHKPFGHPGERARLVTVATYSQSSQANGPRIRLEAEGIPTFLDGERMANSYHVASGGVRLQVPADHASAARILIDQTWKPLPEIAGISDDDDWDEDSEGEEADPAPVLPSVVSTFFGLETLAWVVVAVAVFAIAAAPWIRHLAGLLGIGQ